jgi:hypothetical protein
MPLSVLLSGYFGEFDRGMRPLAPWQGLTERFELVVSRLRSAYLVRWFGAGIPTSGITVRATIVNSDELRTRWLGIGGDRNRRPGPPDQNLLEPLLGTTGLIAGALAAPLNAMLLAPLVWRLFDGALFKTAAVLNWLTFGGLFTALLPLGALAVALGLPLLANTADARSAYELLGALAALAVPLAAFWNQVTGPRALVRNPLLRAVLDLLDRVAAAAIQLVGVTAVLVVRVAPLLEPLVAGARATKDAALALIDMIRVSVVSTVDGVHGWWSGRSSPLAVLRGVVRLVTRLFDAVPRIVAATGTKMLSLLRFDVLVTGMALAGALSTVRGAVRSQTVEHPTVRWLRSFLQSIAALRAWRRRTTPPAAAPSPPGLVGRTARSLGTALLRRTGMPATVPQLALPASLFPLLAPPGLSLLDTSRLLTAGRPRPGGAPLAGRTPPSVFGGAWRELQRESESAESRVRAIAAADYLQRLAPLVEHRAGQLAGPPMASVLPLLDDALERLEHALRSDRSRRHPTRLLEAPREMRPVIGRLVVRAEAGAGARPRFEDFVVALRAELDRTPYPVPTGGGR